MKCRFESGQGYQATILPEQTMEPLAYSRVTAAGPFSRLMTRRFQ